MNIFSATDRALLALVDYFVLFMWDQFSLPHRLLFRAVFFITTALYIVIDPCFTSFALAVVSLVFFGTLDFALSLNKHKFEMEREQLIAVVMRLAVVELCIVDLSADFFFKFRLLHAVWLLFSVAQFYIMYARVPRDPPRRRWSLSSLFPEPLPLGAQ